MKSTSFLRRRQRRALVEPLEGRRLLAAVIETIGPFTITANPISATQIGGRDPANGWFNVVNQLVTASDAFSGPTPITDRGLSIDDGIGLDLTWGSGALVNGPGKDLVIITGSFYEGSAINVNDHGLFGTFQVGLPGEVATPVGSKSYFNNGFGPFSVDLVARVVDLSDVGVPAGEVVTSMKFFVIDDGDFLGLGSLSSAGTELSGMIGGPLDKATISKTLNTTLTVNNTGPGPVSGSLDIQYFLSADTVLDPADLLVGTDTQEVDFQGSTSLTSTLTIPGAARVGPQFLIARIDSANAFAEANEADNIAVAAITVFRLSGAVWAAEFPTSKSLSDLESVFAASVGEFIRALETAGATVSINATFRPLERAYMMHYAWRIAFGSGKNAQNPDTVPAMDGVFIDWSHATEAQSEAAAAELSAALGVAKDLKVPPALNSRHTTGEAIDMNIRWKGQPIVMGGDGIAYKLKGAVSDTNRTLMDIGATYAVIHFGYNGGKPSNDKPHWSIDGR